MATDTSTIRSTLYTQNIQNATTKCLCNFHQPYVFPDSKRVANAAYTTTDPSSSPNRVQPLSLAARDIKYETQDAIDKTGDGQCIPNADPSAVGLMVSHPVVSRWSKNVRIKTLWITVYSILFPSTSTISLALRVPNTVRKHIAVTKRFSNMPHTIILPSSLRHPTPRNHLPDLRLYVPVE